MASGGIMQSDCESDVARELDQQQAQTTVNTAELDTKIASLGLPVDFVPGTPLPAAVPAGAQAKLSDDARARIQALLKPAPLRFVWTLAATWLTIIGIIWLAEAADAWWATLLAIPLVATRQNILALLIHDQSHKRGFTSKLGDVFTNMLTGWPMLVVTVENYANVHLAHHKQYFDAGDPDYSRKNGKDWTFPMPAGQLLKLFAMDVLIGLFKFKKGKNVQPGQQNRVYREQASPKWVRLAYYAALAGLITWLQLWPVVLIYWIVPLLTFMQLIVRFGAICEHKYNLLDTTLEDSTPLITLRWWEKALLPNINFTYHIYHHLYVGAPFHCLPKIHKIYQSEGLVKEENVFHGYYAYMKFIQDPNNA